MRTRVRLSRRVSGPLPPQRLSSERFRVPFLLSLSLTWPDPPRLPLADALLPDEAEVAPERNVHRALSVVVGPEGLIRPPVHTGRFGRRKRSHPNGISSADQGQKGVLSGFQRRPSLTKQVEMVKAVGHRIGSDGRGESRLIAPSQAQEGRMSSSGFHLPPSHVHPSPTA